jgi:hypothetical protein
MPNQCTVYDYPLTANNSGNTHQIDVHDKPNYYIKEIIRDYAEQGLQVYLQSNDKVYAINLEATLEYDNKTKRSDYIVRESGKATDLDDILRPNETPPPNPDKSAADRWSEDEIINAFKDKNNPGKLYVKSPPEKSPPEKRPINCDQIFPNGDDEYACSYCNKCKLRSKCTKSKGNRKIEVSHRSRALRNKAREYLESEKGLDLRSKRGVEVESVFGHIKANRGLRRFLLRGIDKVNIEWGLACIAHNMIKVAAF